MIDPTTRIRRNPDVVFRPLEEEQGGVLLHLQSGEYHGLNELGSLIWGLIEKRHGLPTWWTACGLRRRMRRPRWTRTCPASSRT